MPPLNARLSLCLALAIASCSTAGGQASSSGTASSTPAPPPPPDVPPPPPLPSAPPSPQEDPTAARSAQAKVADFAAELDAEQARLTERGRQTKARLDHDLTGSADRTFFGFKLGEVLHV